VSSEIDREGTDRVFASPEIVGLVASSTDRGLRRRKRSNPCVTGRICSIGIFGRKVIMEILVEVSAQDDGTGILRASR
jgi:hypothetical protein